MSGAGILAAGKGPDLCDKVLLSTSCNALAASLVPLGASLEGVTLILKEVQFSSVYGTGVLGGKPAIPGTTFHPSVARISNTACPVLPTSVAPESPILAMFKSLLHSDSLNFVFEKRPNSANFFDSLNSKMSLGPSHISRSVAALRMSACSPITFADALALSASVRAIFADFAALCASSVVIANNVSLYSWRFLSAKNIPASNTPSPTTPIITNTHPILANVLCHSGPTVHLWSPDACSTHSSAITPTATISV